MYEDLNKNEKQQHASNMYTFQQMRHAETHDDEQIPADAEPLHFGKQEEHDSWVKYVIDMMDLKYVQGVFKAHVQKPFVDPNDPNAQQQQQVPLIKPKVKEVPKTWFDTFLSIFPQVCLKKHFTK